MVPCFTVDYALILLWKLLGFTYCLGVKPAKRDTWAWQLHYYTVGCPGAESRWRSIHRPSVRVRTHSLACLVSKVSVPHAHL